MRKKVEEQKVKRFKVEMDAQHDQNRPGAKKEEDARMVKAVKNLQTEKEERERIVNDYEMRFSAIGKNYKFKFNNEYSDWYDIKRIDGKRRTILLKLLLHHKKHATNENMLDDDTLLLQD